MPIGYTCIHTGEYFHHLCCTNTPHSVSGCTNNLSTTLDRFLCKVENSIYTRRVVEWFCWFDFDFRKLVANNYMNVATIFLLNNELSQFCLVLSCLYISNTPTERPKVTSLVARGRCAQHLHDTRATWRTSCANFARSICVTYARDSRQIRVTSTNRRKCTCRALAQQGMLLLDPSVTGIDNGFWHGWDPHASTLTEPVHLNVIVLWLVSTWGTLKGPNDNNLLLVHCVLNLVPYTVLF
jgi:hypothetical protein